MESPIDPVLKLSRFFNKSYKIYNRNTGDKEMLGLMAVSVKVKSIGLRWLLIKIISKFMF